MPIVRLSDGGITPSVSGTKVSSATSFVKSIAEKKQSPVRSSVTARPDLNFNSSLREKYENSPIRLNPETTAIRQKSRIITEKSIYPAYFSLDGTKNALAVAAAAEIKNTASFFIRFQNLFMQIISYYRFHAFKIVPF